MLLIWICFISSAIILFTSQILFYHLAKNVVDLDLFYLLGLGLCIQSYLIFCQKLLLTWIMPSANFLFLAKDVVDLDLFYLLAKGKPISVNLTDTLSQLIPSIKFISNTISNNIFSSDSKSQSIVCFNSICCMLLQTQ